MNLDLSEDFAQRHGRIQHPAVFFILCFFTFGLYAIWWQYKVWRFFKEKDDLTIYPVARAIFSLFFIHGLLHRLDYEVQEKGHQGINSGTYATLYIVVAIAANIISRLPAPLDSISIFIPAYIFLIPSLKQFNYYWEQESPYAVPRTMSSGAVVALIFGILTFLLAVLGSMLPD